MTSSQEPPLTRRELRERERLREQQGAPATPDAAPIPSQAPPAQQQPPAQPPVQQPVQPVQPPPAPPAYAAPRSAGSYGEQPSPFGGAIATPAPANPFAPRTEQPAPPTPPQPRYPDAVVSEPTPERTLTRRELRAMLDANSAEFEELGFDDDHAAEAPQAPAAPVVAPQSAPYSPPQAAPYSPPQPAAPIPPQPAAPFPPQPAPVRAPAPHQVAESAIADEPVPAPKPVGHWTAQLNAPVDRAEPFDQLLSRGGVSHGVPTTTNALILPTLPDHGSMGSSLPTGGGEVIVTGSIDLPRSYGATGVHPSQIDSSDVDRLFDQVEDGAGVGAPVAATSAISTQGAARAMMAPPKKEGMNVPLVLAVTAGVLALGVVATLVIGALAGLF